jgi:predicted GIY-YIG superfamily endonuclease
LERELAFFTYIMASKPYGTLYTGYTDDIWRRVAEHRAMETHASPRNTA